MAEFRDTAPLNKPPDTLAKLLADTLFPYFSLKQTKHFLACKVQYLYFVRQLSIALDVILQHEKRKLP